MTYNSVRSRIAQWQHLNQSGQAQGQCPAELTVGQDFEQTYTFSKRSIFWTQGLKANDDGQVYGSGRFNIELWILGKLGMDLQTNPYALNETLRILFRNARSFSSL